MQKISLLNERYYSGSELCSIFHFSSRALQNYRDEGIIPYTMIGSKILYRESDINEILEKNYHQ
ncbi:MAG: helix-turn-helix domain-containing protein [Alistipes sp.]|nr:helix-turn-helix domain-containing protein [Alistipes sp.]